MRYQRRLRPAVARVLRAAVVAPLAAAVLVAGCSRVNAENYALVKAGMTRPEVYDILGEPDEVSGGGIGALTVSSETWNGRKQTIRVTFGGEKVAMKSIQANEPAP